MSQVVTLRRQKEAFHYVWKKVQDEVFTFYKGKQHKPDKLRVDEENKLAIIAYIIVKSQNAKLFLTLNALLPFINQNIIEEAAPIITFESAFKAIL